MNPLPCELAPAQGGDLIIVAHPDDEVLEFSTILFSGNLPLPSLIVCTEGHSIRRAFVDELLSTDRLSCLAVGGRSSHFNISLDLDELEQFISNNATGKYGRVWTHNPADDHHQHCAVAAAVAKVFRDSPVFYAHGVANNEYQFISDICIPLSVEQIQEKINILNTHYHDQLKYHPRWLSPGFDTRSVKSTEQFVQLSSAEVKCLYALRHSLDDIAASDEDPWRFELSPYESDRLQSTASWIRCWMDPVVDSVVEVGACEGALTKKLLESGISSLITSEPNAAFRGRLERTLKGTNVTILAASLEELAKSREKPASCYVLSEMLYYLEGSLSLLNTLPTDMLIVSADEDFIVRAFRPWLESNSTWRVVGERTLVEPRLEFCVGNKVYKRKQGSTGLVLYRGEMRR